MKKRFTEWCSSETAMDLEKDVYLKDIEIKLLHAKWLVVVYNFLTLNQGPKIRKNGWKSAGIKEASWKVSVGPDDLICLIFIVILISLNN